MGADDDHDRIIRLEEQLRAQDRAVTLSREVLDERVARLNEFRAALSDAQATMMPRNEVQLLISGVEQRLRALETKSSGTEGRGAGIQWVVVTLLLGAGLIVSVIVALKP